MSKTHVALILDMSGSMNRIYNETVNGVVDYIKNLQKESPEALFSLTVFDTIFEQWVENTPVKAIKPKRLIENYKPRGFTALNDAIGRTVNEVKGLVSSKDKAIVVIITDGGENASREFTTQQIQSLISKLDEKKNWTFVFLAANINAFSVGRQYGFAQGNIAQYDYANSSVAFKGVVSGTTSLLRSDELGTASFYSDAGLSQDFTEKIKLLTPTDVKEPSGATG